MNTKRIKSTIHPKKEPPRSYRLLMAVTSLEQAGYLLPLSETIVNERGGQLFILLVVPVEKDRALNEAAAQVSRYRAGLVKMLSRETESTAQIKTIVRYQQDVWEGVWESVVLEDVDLLLLQWSPTPVTEDKLGALINPTLLHPPCDVVAVRPPTEFFGPEDWQAAHHILLPVRGGANSGLTLRIGHALANLTNGEITLLHVTQESTRESENQFFEEFNPALQGLKRITRSVTTKGDIPNEVVKEGLNHQVIVMGAPVDTRPNSWTGPLLTSVIAETDCILLVVKEHRPTATVPTLREEPVSVQVDRPVAVLVDNWFAENTYHSREFVDLERLLNLKEEQGVSISLGLPALNEEETVGTVIQAVKTALMDEVPLLDEIVLIDSGSVDYTREIASDLEIPVYLHQEILPEYGTFRGKGEALWKSMHVLNGDILAWIDTDIKNIHPRFVYGIIGPLLRDANVKYVKGFYRRPLRKGDKLIAGGGGRVTELTARPFINLFYPELSGLIQPLAGEYAGRREALECLPFFTGYGVETGLLIDLLQKYGLSAIAQVDLLERIHHNQPLPSLSKMSFAIMQVVFKRLSKRHKVDLLSTANLTMNLIRYGPNQFYLETEEIREHERPPITMIPDYRKKRGLPALSDNRQLMYRESSAFPQNQYT